MADRIQFELVSPERRLVSVGADMVVIPGVEGDLGAMPGHAPFLTSLRPGLVTVHDGGATTEYVVTGGFAEVSGDAVAVLAEEAMERAALTRDFLDGKIAEAEEALARVTPELQAAAAQRLNDFRSLGPMLGL